MSLSHSSQFPVPSSDRLNALRPPARRTSHGITAWAIALALGLGAASGAHAAAVTVPAGLNPGDTYRIVFVTGGASQAVSNDITTYNAHVTARANMDPGLLALATSWTALASTATVNVLANTGLSALDTTTPFYNTAGNLVATGVTVPTTGLYGGSTTAHVNAILNEIGAVMPANNENTWTGTNSDGTTAVGAALGSLNVMYGNTNLTDLAWTQANSVLNLRSYLVYGVSGVLTVPAPAGVPEPSTLALMGGAILALGFAKIRQSRQ